MKLLEIHEDYIARTNSRQPMRFSSLPISPINKKAIPGAVPLVTMQRWKKDDGPLVKTFKFRTLESRNAFIRGLLEHEDEVQHRARININDDSVTLVLFTKDTNTASELDNEYAKFADMLFKDAVMVPIEHR